MRNVLFLLHILIGFSPKPIVKGMSTIFGQSDDKTAGGKLACQPTEIVGDSYVCASRDLACGTVLILQNPKNDRISYCVVRDKGPWGATLPDGSWALKRRFSDPGVWRGSLDISPASAKLMHHNGMQRIVAWKVGKI